VVDDDEDTLRLASWCGRAWADVGWRCWATVAMRP
jgi:hypothetical protein